ncbi:hypothetical protein D3C87_715890 [compost metagenome]
MLTVAGSLSVMVAVPVAVAMVVSPVIPESVAVKVSLVSVMLSLITGTVKVCVAPLTDPAGKVTVPVVAV